MIVAIFSGGEFKKTKILPYDKLICADKGYKYAKKLRLKPDYILGDFDSLGYIPKNATVYPCDKNYSDTQLAIVKAKELGATEIHLYYALGGRVDHQLFNINLLKFAKNLGITATLYNGSEFVKLIDGANYYTVKANETVSVAPFSDSSRIIKSEGLKYPLDDIVVVKGETLTLSNVALSSKIYIEIESGELLLIGNL